MLWENFGAQWEPDQKVKSDTVGYRIKKKKEKKKSITSRYK